MMFYYALFLNNSGILIQIAIERSGFTISGLMWLKLLLFFIGKANIVWYLQQEHFNPEILYYGQNDRFFQLSSKQSNLLLIINTDSIITTAQPVINLT